MSSSDEEATTATVVRQNALLAGETDPFTSMEKKRRANATFRGLVAKDTTQ